MPPSSAESWKTGSQKGEFGRRPSRPRGLMVSPVFSCSFTLGLLEHPLCCFFKRSGHHEFHAITVRVLKEELAHS